MKPKLLPVDQILRNDIQALDQQIKIRKELISQMVGELYPRALREEIIKLANYRDQLIYDRACK